MPIPNDPTEHLYEHRIYGEKGSVMSFPKITDSGFGHTQMDYDKIDIDYDNTYQELSDIVEIYKKEIANG